jgi:hypothetical protein
MSNKQQDRRIVVRAVRRDPPDVRKLARVLIELARAQAEAEAQAEHEARKADAGTEEADAEAS